jgi:hypothetical protein
MVRYWWYCQREGYYAEVTNTKCPVSPEAAFLYQSTSDSVISIASVMVKKQALDEKLKLKGRPFLASGHDQLFRALAHSVGLLADLHKIKHWLESAGYPGGTVIGACRIVSVLSSQDARCSGIYSSILDQDKIG